MNFDAVVSYLRELNFVTMVLRFLVAGLCGAVIGYSRGRLQRPAGFRTHVLVCVGAASTVIVSQFCVNELGINGDALRVPAQVISGIGFLGAGSILVTGKYRNHITGLTTAAGLWASACMGLAAGAGYYECAIMMCVVIYAALVPLFKLDTNYVKTLHSMTLYVEVDANARLSGAMCALNVDGMLLNTIEPFGSSGGDYTSYKIEVELLDRNLQPEQALERIRSIEMVQFAQRIEA